MVVSAGLVVSDGSADARTGTLKLSRITGIAAVMDVVTVLVTLTALAASAFNDGTSSDVTRPSARTPANRIYLVTFQE
jgi:NADH:ubiquinone oxidoreductase subunit 4 (subunit M)